MMIALVTASGLHGSERGQLVSVNDEKALTGSFESCIDSRSYAFINCKRPIVVCCLKDTNNKEAIHSLTQKVIDKECQFIDEDFARMTKINWYFGAMTKIKNVESDQWMDRKDTNRTTLCAVYSIGDRVTKEDLLEINSLVNESPRTPFLIVATSSNLKSACQVVEADTASFNVEFSAALLESAKELAINEIDTVLNRNESLEDLLKTSEKLSVKTKFFQFNNNEKKPVGYISVFSKFFTNHWGKLAGVSLVAFLAYYYNFAR